MDRRRDRGATDEIVVAPGTYFETIDFIGKAVWLHSSDGAAVTIIDAQQTDIVVACVNFEGPDTVLDGFTITGGNADGAFPDSARRWATEGHMGNVGSALFLVRQHQ